MGCSTCWRGCGGVREDMRSFVIEHLGDAGAVLVADKTGDLKKGTATAGCTECVVVARQQGGRPAEQSGACKSSAAEHSTPNARGPLLSRGGNW
jgi:SRSO17 transposase